MPSSIHYFLEQIGKILGRRSSYAEESLAAYIGDSPKRFTREANRALWLSASWRRLEAARMFARILLHLPESTDHGFNEVGLRALINLARSLSDERCLEVYNELLLFAQESDAKFFAVVNLARALPDKYRTEMALRLAGQVGSSIERLATVIELPSDDYIQLSCPIDELIDAFWRVAPDIGVAKILDYAEDLQQKQRAVVYLAIARHLDSTETVSRLMTPVKGLSIEWRFAVFSELVPHVGDSLERFKALGNLANDLSGYPLQRSITLLIKEFYDRVGSVAGFTSSMDLAHNQPKEFCGAVYEATASRAVLDEHFNAIVSELPALSLEWQEEVVYALASSARDSLDRSSTVIDLAHNFTEEKRVRIYRNLARDENFDLLAGLAGELSGESRCHVIAELSDYADSPQRFSVLANLVGPLDQEELREAMNEELATSVDTSEKFAGILNFVHENFVRDRSDEQTAPVYEALAYTFGDQSALERVARFNVLRSEIYQRDPKQYSRALVAMVRAFSLLPPDAHDQQLGVSPRSENFALVDSQTRGLFGVIFSLNPPDQSVALTYLCAQLNDLELPDRYNRVQDIVELINRLSPPFLRKSPREAIKSQLGRLTVAEQRKVRMDLTRQALLGRGQALRQVLDKPLGDCRSAIRR